MQSESIVHVFINGMRFDIPRRELVPRDQMQRWLSEPSEPLKMGMISLNHVGSIYYLRENYASRATTAITLDRHEIDAIIKYLGDEFERV